MHPLATAQAQAFLRDHATDDPARVALLAPKHPELPVRLLADQLRVRQKAKAKAPTWHSTEGVIFPPDLNFQQASSEATARFKASFLGGDTLLDLTMGTGLDTWALAQQFSQVHAVEHDEALVSLMQHNAPRLGLDQLTVHQGKAEELLAHLPQVDAIYLDPARRGEAGKKLVRLQDYQPDAVALLPLLLEKAHQVLLKVSPLLDITFGLKALQGHVAAVYVVAHRLEVKELLFLLDRQSHTDPPIHCVELRQGHDSIFSFRQSAEAEAQPQYAKKGKHRYKLHPAVSKAGAFKLAAVRLGLSKKPGGKHLYLAETEVANAALLPA